MHSAESIYNPPHHDRFHHQVGGVCGSPRQVSGFGCTRVLLWLGCRFGVPKVIFTDQEKCFTSEVMELLAARLGIKSLRSVVYHPQGNAPIESFHRVLSKGIQQFQCVGTQLSLPEVIDYCLFAYRASLHHGINESPAFMLYGCDLRPPLESDWRFVRNVSEKERLAYLSRVRLEIMARAQWLATKGDKKRRRDWKFELHDLVLLRIPDKELNMYARVEGSIKVVPKWTVPYRVIHVSHDGRAAKVRSLLTGVSRNVNTKEVHIENARFVERPTSINQQQEWAQVLKQELEKTVFDGGVRATLIREFWERIDDVSDRRKRPRHS